MHINTDWVYRKVHIFHILINMRNNRVLSISSTLATLFEHEQNLDCYLESLRSSLTEDQKKSLMSCIVFLEQSGVLADA